jgi:hypothetical protein
MNFNFSPDPNYVSKLSNRPGGRPRSLEVKEKVPRKRSKSAEIKTALKRVQTLTKVKTKLIHDLEKVVKENGIPSPTSQTNYLESTSAYKNVDNILSPGSTEILYVLTKSQEQNHKSKGKYSKTLVSTQSTFLNNLINANQKFLTKFQDNFQIIFNEKTQFVYFESVWGGSQDRLKSNLYETKNSE